jgi:hypothetical protein
MTKYTDMCQAFADKVDFNAKSPVPSPAGSPFDAAKLQAVVNQTAPSMNQSYRASYAQPLVARMPQLVVELQNQMKGEIAQGTDPKEAHADVQSMADTLVGAVRDWSVPAYAAPLKRFEAVISNLYRSFLSRNQRAGMPAPLIETVPPLVTFAPLADQGPFTVPADDVEQLIGVKIGVVSLPGSYREHPLTWSALAHECGGHDVVHADPGLEQELARGAEKLPHLPAGVGRLWGSWMDEAVADVYGLLNVGPAFAINLAAFFSALRAAGARGRPKLGPISNILPLVNGRPADVHPVDLLRVYLAIGVTAQLTSLSSASKTSWLAQLQTIATEAGGGVTSIDVVEETTGQVVQKLPLADMAAAAQAVGGYIATAKLQTLSGHSIQDIETWDDADEAAGQTIFQAAKAGKSLVGLGDDAQLLAGTNMAFYDDASRYDAITAALNDALDDSYLRDPVFGPPSAFRAAAKRRVGRAYSTSPIFPLFPLAAFPDVVPAAVGGPRGRRR